MTLCQEKYISFDKLQNDLDISADEAEILRDCPLLTIDRERNCSFIHNAFKEYLAAVLMSKLDKSSILKLICYPDSEKLRPAMQNTLILLIDNIPEDSLTRNQIIGWLVTQDSELLVRCGGELLDVQTRQQIFRDIIYKYKEEDLLLGSYFCDHLMEFCNTKESTTLLFDECQPGVYSRHLANITGLLSSARFELLSHSKRHQLTEKIFNILGINISDKEHGNSFASVLDNPVFQNKEVLDRFIELIGDSDNPYYIRQAIEIAYNLGLCDEYAGWILSNYRKIHSFYIPRTNINHMVFDDISEKAMSAMQQPSNIIDALTSIYSEKDCEEPSKEKGHLISKLLENLAQKARLIDISAPLCSMLRHLKCGHIGLLLLRGCGAVLDICGGDKLFDDQLARSIKQFHEFANNKKSDSFLAEMNILSCMINPSRLRRIFNDGKMNDNQLEAFCSWLLLYPVSDEIRNEIHTHFKMPVPESEQDRKQHSFDDLFKAKKGKDLISALPTADRLGAVHLHITDTQRNTIKSAVKKVLNSNKPITETQLLSVIATYEPDLDDSELIKLFPYSFVQVKYLPKIIWDHERWGAQIYSYSHFIRYIEDHITDNKLIDNAIENVASSSDNYSDEFLETCVRFIVNRHRKCLYYKLETLIDRIMWQGKRLSLCVEIANRIEGGFSMIVDYTDSFEPVDKLIFYESSLFPTDKSILNSQEQILAVQKTEEIFLTTKEDDQKEKAIGILVHSGHPSALDYVLKYLEDHPEWIESEYFPSLGKYGYESLSKLESLFCRACEIPYNPHYRFNSFDSTLDALKRIGSSTILARDHVVELMRQKAATTTHNELYLYARETLDKYYEENNPVPSLKEACDLYGRYVVNY